MRTNHTILMCLAFYMVRQSSLDTFLPKAKRRVEEDGYLVNIIFFII